MPGVIAEELSHDFGKLAEKTYDEKGHTFKILHINTDKLPKLSQANDLQVKLPSKVSSPIEISRVSSANTQDNILRLHGPKQQDFTEEGNLNIKASMKAGHGIIYKEDNYRESGPSYIEKFGSAQKYTL